MLRAPADSPWTVPLVHGPVSARLDRAVAATIAAAAAALTIALARVAPDPRGHGTHEQLGMPACGWPLHYGIPCPTCGCTTAACRIVHGDLLGAFVVQPFGAALMLAVLLVGAHAVACLVRGRSFVDLLVRLPFWRIVAGAVVLLLAAWGYKVLVWAG